MSYGQDYIPPGKKAVVMPSVDYVPPGKTESDILQQRKVIKEQIMRGDGTEEGEARKDAFATAEAFARAGAGQIVTMGNPVPIKEMTKKVGYRDVYKEQMEGQNNG